MSMGICSSFVMFLGRICMSALFIKVGLAKLMGHQLLVDQLQMKAVPFAGALAPAGAVLALLGGLFLLLGFRTRLGAMILAILVLTHTLILHDFWNQSAELHAVTQRAFLFGMALFGGLLYILACGAGKIGCDRCCCKKESCCPSEKK